MSRMTYSIERFLGLNQSVGENFLNPGFSPDAKNMCTDDGTLKVARGYVKAISRPVPGTDKIRRLFVFRRAEEDTYIVVADEHIYANAGSSWISIHTFPKPLTDFSFDMTEATIAGKDYIIIGTGEGQLIKFDGMSISKFGSADMQSDKPVRYLAMYMNRLFTAGDKDHPNRLYWSQLPGDDRSIENWGPYDASPNVEGGHVEVGPLESDRITALVPLSSQLLIFKKNSVYRLYGDRPSNFAVEEVESDFCGCAHTAIVHNADAAYFMTGAGLHVFDGVSVYKTANADCIKNIIAESDMSSSRGAKTRDKLYFTFTKAGEDSRVGTGLIEYDINRGVYMLRDGFRVVDTLVRNNTLHLINDNRYIYCFDEGTSYDGEPIEAYWRTPRTDLGKKSVIKHLNELYVRGGEGEQLTIETETDGQKREEHARLNGSHVSEIKLLGEGRSFCITFKNTAGGGLCLDGGVEVNIHIRERSA